MDISKLELILDSHVNGQFSQFKRQVKQLSLINRARLMQHSRCYLGSDMKAFDIAEMCILRDF